MSVRQPYPVSSSSGSGDVTKVGTPVNNQVGVWTGDGTIEGDTAFTFDTATDSLSIGTSGILTTGTIELGAASDTTISRASAGAISVETIPVLLAGSTTAGQIPRITGANTYGWGALDLADTDAVTGVLPSANATQIWSYGMFTNSGRIATLNDGATYYLGALQSLGTSTTEDNYKKIIVPITGKLVYGFCNAVIAGTLGSNEAVTFTIRVNGAPTALTWTQTFDVAQATLGSDTDTGINVTQGDYITCSVLMPTFTTNPSNFDYAWGVGVKTQ